MQFGRRTTFLVTALLTIVGNILQAAAQVRTSVFACVCMCGQSKHGCIIPHIRASAQLNSFSIQSAIHEQPLPNWSIYEQFVLYRFIMGLGVGACAL